MQTRPCFAIESVAGIPDYGWAMIADSSKDTFQVFPVSSVGIDA